MKRKKKYQRGKRLVMTMLAALVLIGSSCNGIGKGSIYAKEAEETSTTEVSEEDLLSKISASQNNTEVKKVAVDPTSIAQTQVYKDMDYSFLKTYSFGQRSIEKVKVTFGSTEEMKTSDDARLREGKFIKTEGYYKSGDGGSAVYEIMSEWNMGQAKRKEGAIQLANGLYACIVPDVCEIDGKTWVVVNVRQFGAIGDGVTPSQSGISYAATSASRYAASNEDVFRGLVYIPSGEYKCTNEIIGDGLNNVNIVGDGDSSVLFTDNDYRANEGYSEFFFATWNAKNIYFGDFRIEAREVDLYHYMRQFVLIYCDNVYIYNVDMVIPQETYSAYYYEDKQYSNFCCYSGDTNVTVDGCTMIQFSGTYRGANVGIMDFWDREVKNITVMNCDLYSNARDEQIGIFNIPKTGSHVNENTSISNVDLINNSIHTIPVKYTEVIGHQNMCFTVAYSDSKRIDDVRIAGNHFICQADSKFMTFGTITNCVVEDNIIEIISTRTNGASVFDSSNGDEKNIIIRNNEFFLSSTDGKQEKAGFSQGKMTLEGNKIFAEVGMSFAVVGKIAKNNEFVFLKPVAMVCNSVGQVEGNTFYLYGGTWGDGKSNNVFGVVAAGGWKDVTVKNNTVYDYKRSIGVRAVWDALVTGSTLSNGNETMEFSGNKYYAPNKKFTGSGGHYTMRTGNDEEDQAKGLDKKEDVDWIIDENGKQKITTCYNRITYFRGLDGVEIPLKKVIFKDNVLQGVKGYTEYAKPSYVEYVFENNTTLPYREDLSEDEPVVSSVDILYNNQKTTEISVTGDTVKLDKIVRVAAEKDEEGNILSEQETTDKEIKWYTSVESMAHVTEDGTVTRKMYGDVKVYAVPTDGSGVYGECTIHFQKNKATGISLKKNSIELQPGLKYYADYTVLPKEANQNLKWTSSNEEIATVSDTGLIIAKEVGDVVITGTTTDGSGISGTISVKVTPVTVKKMSMDTTWLYFTEDQIGESKQLAVTSYTPENATNKVVKRWESSDPSVAEVDQQGKVTIKGSGLASIRAYSTDEYCYASCTVYVQPAQVKNFKVDQINKTEVALSWEPVEKCYGYMLYQWDDSTSEWKQLNYGKGLEPSVTSYTVNNLEANKEYKFCIRSYYRRWYSSGSVLYESKDSTVSARTYSYTPVTRIAGSSDVFTIIEYKGVKEKEFTIKYNSSADYENLDFTYEIEDESIARVKSVADKTSGYAKDKEKSIVIEGLKYGTTMLTVTSNDERHTSVRIPVGVIADNKVTNCTANAVYKQITISFDGLEDETNIDGYFVRLVTGINRYKDIGFVVKTGERTYSYVDTNVEPGVNASPRGWGYQYTVSPCVTDGTYYHPGNQVLSNGGQPIFVPGIIMGEKQYVVAPGESMTVSAKLEVADQFEPELDWEISNDQYASVERVEPEDGEEMTNYAKVTGLDAGVTKVIAGTKDGAIEEYAKLIVTPQAVQDVKAKAEGTNVSLSWKAIKNANGYVVSRWDESTQEYQKLSEVTENAFQDLDLEENTSYKYQISAFMNVDGVRYDGKTTSDISVTTSSKQEDNDKNDDENKNENKYGIKVTGYSGYYDGNSHKAVTVEGIMKDIDTVTYSTDHTNWTAEVPIVTEVKDSGDIYVKVERQGEPEAYEEKVTATVLAAPISSTDISLKEEMVEWDGKKHTPEIISETCIINRDYTAAGIQPYENIGTYRITVIGMGNYTGTKELVYEIGVVKGHKYTVSGYIYKVTGDKTAAVSGVTSKKKTSITVKDTIKIGGKAYKITVIDANAFKNCKKLKKATIGKNVTTIGKNAFYGDKKLKTITINSKSLKTVGKNAIKGIDKKAQIKVPKSKRSKYKKLFKKSTGYVSTMKLK